MSKRVNQQQQSTTMNPALFDHSGKAIATEPTEASRCLSPIAEDLETLGFWTDQWANEQAELDEVSPCDEEERKVIKATQRILRACKDRYRATCVTDRDYGGRWCPAMCPITFARFFMWIEHPDRGWVPTYGGPFDSYTIPEPECDGRDGPLVRTDVEYRQERFDHDEGAWRESEGVDIRTITDESLMEIKACLPPN